MRSTIDAAGRVVIPKSMREAIGVGAGGEIDIDLVDGLVHLSAPTVRKRLVDRDGRTVIAADEHVPPLSDDLVRDVVHAVRR